MSFQYQTTRRSAFRLEQNQLGRSLSSSLKKTHKVSSHGVERAMSHGQATRTFNALINRLSSQGSHHEVLVNFASMLRANAPSDAHTFPSLLKACASLSLFRLGASIHQRVIVNGFSSDPYTASSLLSFYAKLGFVDRARKVFDAMPDRNVVPWTAIIGCYSRVGNIDESFYLFGESRRCGIETSPVTLLSLLSGVSELAQVQCLHCCAVTSGYERNVSLMNCVINAYGKFGGFDYCKKLFETMTGRDVVSWNSLISGCIQSGNVGEIVDIFAKMRAEIIEPDQQTLVSLLSASGVQSDLKLGKLVHGKLLRAGFRSDCIVETTLLVMYMKCGSVDTALDIFERIKNKDVILWTAVISGLVHNDFTDKALTVLHQMLKSGIKSSTATMASSLSACAKLGSFHLGTSIHCFVLRQGITLDTPAQNSLITMYAKCGRVNQSRSIFERMEKRDLVSWNAIVAGYAQNGYLMEGLTLLTEMRTSLQKSDSITVVSLLQACASLGALHQGKWIHNFAVRSCIRPCVKVDTALVDMYSKCGDLKNAQKCFDEMSEHDLISWGTIISGYGFHGYGDTALKMYSEFLRTEIKMDRVVFLSVLTACSHSGLVKQGLTVYKSMTEDFGIEPNNEHHACVVDLLSRAGRVEEAYKFYEEKFPEPSGEVLGILLDACRSVGNEILGETIAGDLLKLRPVDAGNYVQLAHSFASMSKWDNVGEAWAQMRSLGLKKLPGWSFIELNGNIDTFFTRHNSHPRLEEIVSALGTLRSEMRRLNRDAIINEAHDIF